MKNENIKITCFSFIIWPGNQKEGSVRLISLNLWRGEQELEVREFLEKNLEQTDIFCFQEAQEAEALLSEILSRHGFLMK